MNDDLMKYLDKLEYVYYCRAYCYYKLERYDEAIDDLMIHTKDFPEHKEGEELKKLCFEKISKDKLVQLNMENLLKKCLDYRENNAKTEGEYVS